MEHRNPFKPRHGAFSYRSRIIIIIIAIAVITINKMYSMRRIINLIFVYNIKLRHPVISGRVCGGPGGAGAASPEGSYRRCQVPGPEASTIFRAKKKSRQR